MLALAFALIGTCFATGNEKGKKACKKPKTEQCCKKGKCCKPSDKKG